MGVIIPTFETFTYWYNEFKSRRCTKDYARQQTGFAKTTWYYLCRDYECGADVSKYFKEDSHG